MNDVLGYSGRRCIVTGAGSDLGDATTRLLVDLGAEVHAVGTRKPDVVGIASFSDTDLDDPAALARTVDAIGAVVNSLFHCAEASLREVAELVVAKMIDGATIASVVGDQAVAGYIAERSVGLVELGIRVNGVRSAHAWPLVLLGSPRSSPVTGATL